MFECFYFFFKQKTAYEMRISDWSSDVCSSDLPSDPKYDFLFTPIAKLASIVTVEAVSADVTSELEKKIESHYQDAHALEMEGFGAALAAATTGTPIMVIRGISDILQDATPEDDAIYKPVAAMHDAAFGLHMTDASGTRPKTSDRNRVGSGK